ncbi:MAG: right-handed parallel beta-helix repeat-containing protein, partial [Thermoplasmata archaeon]
MSLILRKVERSTRKAKNISRKKGKSSAFTLILAASLLASATMLFQTARAEDEWHNDWFIDGTEYREDITIHVDGDLIIGSGGRLVFKKNVELIVYSDWAGEHKIQVNASGQFQILNNSMVKSSSPFVREGYKFFVNGTLNVQNASTVKWMWGNHLGPEGGIQIFSGSDVTIENSTITEGDTHDLYVTGDATPVIKNSNITYAGQYSLGYGILAVDTSTPVIEYNNISNNDQYGIGVISTSSIEIAHNEIWNNTHGIEGNPNTLLHIHNNTIYENSGHGIRLDHSSSGSKVRDNVIYSSNIPSNQQTYEAGIYLVHSSPTVEYNTIKHYTSWSYFAGGITSIGSSPTVAHNLFLHNARGLAVHKNATVKSSPIVEYNNFTNNFAGI